MDCEEVQVRLIHFTEGELPPAERVAVRAHLDRCYYCTEELADLRRTVGLCRRVLSHPEPTGRYRELVERIAALEAEEAAGVKSLSSFRRGFVRGLVRLAAAVVIVLALYPVVEQTRGLLSVLEHPDTCLEDVEFEPHPSTVWCPIIEWRVELNRWSTV